MFISITCLTFAHGPVVAPGGEHLRHPLTADGLAALEDIVLATGEVDLAADTAHTHTHTHTHTHEYMHLHTNKHMHIRMHTQRYTNAHTHTTTHTNI